MRRIERDQRREAVTPVGNVIQRFEIGDRIGIEHAQIRTDRPRIGQGQANLEAKTGSGIIERMDLQRVVLLGDDDAGMIAGISFSRPAVLAPQFALDAVDGQARQPQAENAARAR